MLRPDQHVVSRVVLDQFAEPLGAKGERKLRILNRNRIQSKPTQLGPAGCAKFRHYVRFASESSETHWGLTETRIPDALSAAEQGTFFANPRHAATIRDVMVLHLVRSIPALINSDRCWRQAHDVFITERLRQDRRLLSSLHRARFRRAPEGKEGLRFMAEDLIAPFAAQVDRGIYFRVSVVERFQRFQRMLADQPVQLRQPTEGELLISDAPMLALRNGDPSSGTLDGAGLATCDEAVLPLGPRLLAVLGAGDGYALMGQEEVDRFNAAQVRATADYIYMRPGSGLETFVRSAVTEHWPNRIPAHLRQWDVPATFARNP